MKNKNRYNSKNNNTLDNNKNQIFFLQENNKNKLYKLKVKVNKVNKLKCKTLMLIKKVT